MRDTLRDEDDALAYPFSIPNLRDSGLPYIEPLGMWHALLGDLILGTPAPSWRRASTRGWPKFSSQWPQKLAGDDRASTPSRFPAAASRTRCCSRKPRGASKPPASPCSHSRVPTNDGGLALGQAAIAAAQLTAEV